MTAEISILPELRLAAVHHTGPYMDIGQAFGRLGAIGEAAGLFADPDAAMVGVYYYDPETTAPERLRSHAGIVIPEGVTVPEGLIEVRMAAGRYARATYVGPYDGLPNAWLEIKTKFIPTSGERRRPGPSYEIYRNSPMTTKPADLITEICIPVEAAR